MSVVARSLVRQPPSVAGARKKILAQGSIRRIGPHGSVRYDANHTTMPQKDTTVLYHAYCADGFGAAWAAWLKLGDQATYTAVQHGAEPPDVPESHAVYLLDFSYSRDTVVAMHERVRELHVLDHHQTAAKELEGLDYAIFDNEKSGAVLAWQHFHPEEPVPELLRYVMDKDLWLFELPRSREVSAGLSAQPFDFELWSALDVETLADEGALVLRYQSVVIDTICRQAREIELAGYRVPAVNATMLGSEVGAELLARHPGAPFVVIYFDRGDGKRQWSLRSREDFDVSAVARRFQNGGHRQAAGFETVIPDGFVPHPRK